jgi:Zn-finger nucleic acid-binding protein
MSEATNLCCVKCNSILDRATFQGLEVDLCPKCGGLWLDRGEITRAAKLPEAELTRLRGLLTGAKGPPPVPTENIAHCPSCPGNYCGKCHGIFLDRGELQAAVEAVRAKARDTAAQNIIIAISTAGD